MSQTVVDISINIDSITCKHDWKPCHTPPDSGYRWYRCTKCKAFGRPKKPSSWNSRNNKVTIIVPYRCSISKCNKPAIDRLEGRGPRLCFLWRCEEHAERK